MAERAAEVSYLSALLNVLAGPFVLLLLPSSAALALAGLVAPNSGPGRRRNV